MSCKPKLKLIKPNVRHDEAALLGCYKNIYKEARFLASFDSLDEATRRKWSEYAETIERVIFSIEAPNED